MRKWLQKRLIRFLVHNLFNSITEEDIITIAKQRDVYGKERIIGAYVRKRRLDQQERDALRQGAEQFKDSVLWQFMANEIRFHANKKMFENGVTDNDLLFPRAALFNLKVIEEVIRKMLSL